MNKKGFTLIELIVSVAIIAMLSTIVVKYVSKNITTAKEKALDTMVESIESSAEEYVTNNEGIVTEYATNDWIKISIETLIENDYFSNSLTNPKTKEDIPISDIVYVRRNEKGKIESTYDIEQNEKATITLNGAYNVYVKKGGTYTEKGAVAATKEGINVTSQIVKTGTVDTNTLGTYIITYTYDTVSVTRNVIVVTNEIITERLWHTVTVDPNGGTYSGSTSNKIYSLKEGRNQTIANPTRTNYSFTGWSLTCTSCLNSGIYTMGTADDTLTANWELALVTLTVNLSGGSTTQTFNSTYPKGSTLTLTRPTKTGSFFTGWTASGTGASVSGNTLTFGTGNVILTANWVIFANMFTYTGTYTVVDDGSSNFRIRFLTTGIFTPLYNMTVDIFLVGGGSTGSGSSNGGGGGGGGYTTNVNSVSLTANTAYSVTVGLGGTYEGSVRRPGGTSYFGSYTALGGTNTGNQNTTGGNGGSGGGRGGTSSTATTGKPGAAYGNTPPEGTGLGQGTTTCEFGEGTLSYCNSGYSLFSGGGGGRNTLGGAGGGGNGYGQGDRDGDVNTGGGGGGGVNSYVGAGGSGIVIIRNDR